MSELLPCPFCGGPASIVKGRNVQHDKKVFKAFCLDCQNRTISHTKQQDAIDSWNRRHTTEGWQAVPVEPTRGMYRSAFDELVPVADAGACWKAMLAAAPKPGGE